MTVPSRDARWSDGRITLRAFREDDADELYTAVRESLDALVPWMPWCHPDYSRAESAEWLGRQEALWEGGLEFSLAITEAKGGKLVGGTGLNEIHRMHRHANLGYWVRRGWEGRGIATAAARLAARFGLEEAGLERLEIVVPVGNAPSLRVAEKIGAVREGVLRRRLRLAGAMTDAVMHALVRQEP